VRVCVRKNNAYVLKLLRYNNNIICLPTAAVAEKVACEISATVVYIYIYIYTFYTLAVLIDRQIVLNPAANVTIIIHSKLVQRLAQYIFALNLYYIGRYIIFTTKRYIIIINRYLYTINEMTLYIIYIYA